MIIQITDCHDIQLIELEAVVRYEDDSPHSTRNLTIAKWSFDFQCSYKNSEIFYTFVQPKKIIKFRNKERNDFEGFLFISNNV